MLGIGIGVNRLTGLLDVIPLPNTITITGEPDAGTLTTATAGQTHAAILAQINEGTATTDGPGSVSITATLIGDSTDPVQSGQSITGVYLLYTATEAPSAARNIVFDPAITVTAAPVIDNTAPEVFDAFYDPAAQLVSFTLSEGSTVNVAWHTAVNTLTADGSGGWTGTLIESDSAVVNAEDDYILNNTAASSSADRMSYYFRDAAGNDSVVTTEVYVYPVPLSAEILHEDTKTPVGTSPTTVTFTGVPMGNAGDQIYIDFVGFDLDELGGNLSIIGTSITRETNSIETLLSQSWHSLTSPGGTATVTATVENAGGGNGWNLGRAAIRVIRVNSTFGTTTFDKSNDANGLATDLDLSLLTPASGIVLASAVESTSSAAYALTFTGATELGTPQDFDTGENNRVATALTTVAETRAISVSTGNASTRFVGSAISLEEI